MNTIPISGSKSIEDIPCLIEIDEFVPLRFRTYTEAIGAAYVHLGNKSTTLTELIFHPGSRVLRGVTLTCFASFSPWPDIGEATSSEGLPVLLLDSSPSRTVVIEREFQVSLRADELLISWGNLSQLSSRLVFDKVQFLIGENELKAVRFSKLSEKEVDLLTSYNDRQGTLLS
jgi:hypothetical protein